MRTTGRWIGYCGEGFRRKLVEVVLSLDPHATLTFAPSALDLRNDVLQVPGVHVAIGCTEDDVSEVNLAAAIVADGAAADVTLVVDRASGSLKSRALTAGVADVIDLSQFSVAPMPEFGRPVTVVHGSRVAGAQESDEPEGGYDVSFGDEPGVEWYQDDEPLWDEGVSNDEQTSVLGVGGSEEVTSVLGARATSRAPMTRGVRARDAGAKDERRAAEQVRQSVNAPEHEPRRVLPEASREEAPGRSDETSRESIERGEAPIITFVSGRGGVGKTVMAATAACIASSWGLKVALCDLDFSCGNLYAPFGLPRPADLSGLVDERPNDRERIERMGVPCTEGVRLWGGCTRPEMAEALWPHAGAVLCVASQVSDLVIVDTSSTFTDAVAQSAQLSDRLLITIDGRPGSSVAQSRLGALAVRLGVARTRIARVVNRCDPRGRDETIINRADVGLETARSHRVLEGGETVNEFVAAGQIAAFVQSSSPFVDSLAACMAQLLSEMGRLPNCEAAQGALEQRHPRKRRFFGRRREAV